MLEVIVQLIAGVTREGLEAASEIVNKSKWTYYWSFVPSEQAVIEKVVDVSSIRGKGGAIGALRAFIRQELDKIK